MCIYVYVILLGAFSIKQIKSITRQKLRETRAHFVPQFNGFMKKFHFIRLFSTTHEREPQTVMTSGRL